MATKIHRIMSTEGLTPFLLSLHKLKHIIARSFLNKGRASLLRILLTDGHKVSHSYPSPYTELNILAAPLPPAPSRGSYAESSPSQTNQQWAPAPSSAPYLETGPSASFNRPLSPSYNYSPTAGTSAGPSPTSDAVPPPRRRISPGSSRDQSGPARATGNRPSGVQKCSSCKATSSPEWRKGPSGKKELCNA